MAPYFELPKLTPINISLTDGTDIPPPPESPVLRVPSITIPPPTPAISKSEKSPSLNYQSTSDHASNHRSSSDRTCVEQLSTQQSRTADGDEKTAYDPVPLSPISAKQPSSIRKFLSRRSLHANYSNDSSLSLNLPRPDSAMSYASGKTSFSNGRRRGLGWFSRFSGSQMRKRTSIVIEERAVIELPPSPPSPTPPSPILPPSPPPPMLPKLTQLNARVSNESLGGADLFKDIK